ncbi:MAG: integrase [Deltaproteobacteria bacterium]|nr:integrase [Deltaproteobacteria bacterium]MDP2655348.1 integrase [bacterium]
MKKRYQAADRTGRGQLLDEMEKVTEMHRKSLIRLLSAPDLSSKKRKRQRGRKYNYQVDDAIRVIAESLDYICAERLKPALAEMAIHLSRLGEMQASPELITQLEEVSVATVGRILHRLGQDTYRLPRKGPERANQIAKEIPMGRIPWNESEPGHFEVDTVHHCGAATVGEYVHTLQMVDVATGWSERAAVMGRSHREVEKGFKHIESRSPIPIIQLHPDNGSEFLNNYIIRYLKEAAKGLKLSRSRPFQKNDNRFVEQKNSSLVRAYLGNVRLDNLVECHKLNQIYDKMWLYYNFFQPVMRLTEKQVSYQENGTYKLKHRYDSAMTPFQRLCKTNAISEKDKEKLAKLRDSTNPRELRKEIYHLLDKLLTLAGDRNTRQQEDETQESEKGELVSVTLSNE